MPRYRILFIENEPFDTLEYRECLNEPSFVGEDISFDIELAEDVIQAEAMLTSSRAVHYDVIVIDIMMPNLGKYDDKNTKYGLLTGVAIYEQFIKDKITSPVIILTAANGELWREVCKRLGYSEEKGKGNPQVVKILSKKDTELSDFKENIIKCIWGGVKDNGA